MKPRAAAINLLRVLEAYPEAVWVLRGDERPSRAPRTRPPWQVDGECLEGLEPAEVHELLRLLLSAEAQAHDVPPDGIRVSSKIAAPDGGEDGRIEWRGAPERTPFLPSRLCQFQAKAGPIWPAGAGGEVVVDGEVKPMVKSVLEKNGHYIVLCARRYNQQQIAKREEAICRALRDAGLNDPEGRIQFRDADMIAQWVNHHPSVALWVLERTGQPSLRSFASWREWRDRSEHAFPWVADPRLQDLQAEIRERLTGPGEWLRVEGLSGVGKSRLCLEALGGDHNPEPDHRHRDLVVYAVTSEMPDRELSDQVSKLVRSGRRAIVVVDECDPQLHKTLVELVQHDDSGVFLVTIDYEKSSYSDQRVVTIPQAPASVVEAIVEQFAETLPWLHRRQIARISAGFPAFAIHIGNAGATQLVDPRADYLIDAFVVGRTSRDTELLLRSATLLSAFTLLRVESSRELEPIARLGRHLTCNDLYAEAKQLEARGILKRRGGHGALQPRPIAVRLAERQWTEWDHDTWDRILSGSHHPELACVAAERLAQLNETEIATRVVKHVCRVDGPFDAGPMDVAGARVLACLAEIDAAVVADCLERLLDGDPNASRLGRDVRSALMRALGRIAFPAQTFVDGARLMLRVLNDGTRTANRSLSRRFAALFPAAVGATEADGALRLRFLEEAIEEAVADNDPTRALAVVDALVAGCDRPDAHVTAIGPDIHGSRRALNRWCPATENELAEYVGGCVSRLAELASGDDAVGTVSREELGRLICDLIHRDFIGPVEEAIRRVVTAGRGWTLALRQLKDALQRAPEAIDEETAARVRSLIKLLTPTDLYGRVRILVTEPPAYRDWVVDSEAEQAAAALAEIDALSRELLSKPEVLRGLLPELSRGAHFHAAALGESIAKQAPAPLDWLDLIIEAVEHGSSAQPNHDLLVGFVAGLAPRHGAAVEATKQRIIQSSALAPAFPEICRRIGLTRSDIAQGVAGLTCKTIPSTALTAWKHPEALITLPHAEVARLLEALLTRDGTSYAIGVHILWMMLRDERRNGEDTGQAGLRISDFGTQVLTMTRNAGRWSARGPWTATVPTVWAMARIILPTLREGRNDDHARETALALSKALVHWHPDALRDLYGNALRPVLRELLSEFPGIAWQLIGSAIVSDDHFAGLMALALGEQPAYDREAGPPILSLPEEVLLAWCDAYPEEAPAFAARCLPILSRKGGGGGGCRLHPAVERLIADFGDRRDVQKALERNLHNTGVVSSLAQHYEDHASALAELENHERPGVRRWARSLGKRLKRQIAFERETEQEFTVGLE